MGFGFIHATNLPAGSYTLNVDLTFGRDSVRDLTVSAYMKEKVSIVSFWKASRWADYYLKVTNEFLTINSNQN